MTAPVFTKRTTLGRKLTGGEVDANFQTFSDAIGVTADALTALLARVAAAESAIAALQAAPGGGGGTDAIGDPFYINLPAGTFATIYVQRNGVDIPGAVSAPNSSTYTYVLTADDLVEGTSLTPRLASITYDTVIPARFSTSIENNERDTIKMVFGKVMKSNPAMSQFSLGGPGASGKTLVSIIATNDVVKFKLSAPVAYGDVVTLTYTGAGSNKFRDYADNLAADFANVVVANNIERGVVAQLLPSLEAGSNDGTSGWFTGQGGIYGVAWAKDYALPAQSQGTDYEDMYTDGWLEMQCQDADPVARILMLENYLDSNNAYKCRYQAVLVGGVLQAARGHGGVEPDESPTHGTYSSPEGPTFAFPAPSASCWTRLRRFEDKVTVEYSINNKTTWTVLYTYPESEVDPLYGHLGLGNDNAGTTPLIGVGLVGFRPVGSAQET